MVGEAPLVRDVRMTCRMVRWPAIASRGPERPSLSRAGIGGADLLRPRPAVESLNGNATIARDTENAPAFELIARARPRKTPQPLSTQGEMPPNAHVGATQSRRRSALTALSAAFTLM